VTSIPETEASAAIHNLEGKHIGELVIETLPARQNNEDALQIVRESPDAEDSILLLEDSEYWYQVKLQTPGPYTSDRNDVFIWDPTRDRGHLRPGSHVGFLPVSIFAGGALAGTAELEVRSRKLGYLDDYRWMLNDIAATSAELLMERFAVAQQYFKAERLSGAGTAYGRFEFLRSIVSSEALGAAWEQVMHRPHHEWVLEPELMSAAGGVPAGGMQLKELFRQGPRVPWPAATTRLTSVPARVHLHRPQATYDTLPNRFVKFALNRWRTEIDNLQSVCRDGLVGPPLDRAIRETQGVIDWLDSALAWPIFGEVSDLEQFPANNTVLIGREGYREFYAAFGLFELVADLAWEGGDAVYRAGQRDVATLYEYWCFMQLAALVRGICGSVEASLITIDRTGTKLDLRRGRQSVLSGSVTRLGRRIDAALFFNREFATGAGGDHSWTRAMRPDCSLQLTSPDDLDSETVWVHFDAKYRIDRVDQIFTDALEVSAEDEGGAPSKGGRAKREDLLKMHAYRDAIRRSAGSYVLYPGPNEPQANTSYRRFHEVLPGIGAFALKPSQTGQAEGVEALRSFVEDVITHHASLLTQQRRGRYWEGVSFSARSLPGGISGWQPTRRHPAADTPALLGYVRSAQHLAWILRLGRYNLRLGSRKGAVGVESSESRVEVLVLSGPSMTRPRVFIVQPPPEIWSRSDLISTGYGAPGGDVYLCLVIDQEIPVSAEKEEELSLRVARFSSKDGSPTVTTWSNLAVG